ncbi:Hypothetical protein LOCK900_2188 [Lacticaseibacillus rhamnosus LOCK900]|nr:Hypothetical protein LOCK900_2188 [Lacticaseibacillus rhamnosus LOCK900]ASY48147.1 hypothetical protein N507_0963 [Lacticaseibacillus rhamnosus DSM 14870]
MEVAGTEIVKVDATNTKESKSVPFLAKVEKWYAIILK